VILGSGWGAVSLLKGIDPAKFDVTVGQSNLKP
jgi:NADH dehydrogenase FAD-containing subunit